jgi:phosphoglucomutase
MIHPEIARDSNLSIVYTPLHGTGNIPVRRALAEAGFKNVHVVPEQELPDSEFSTVSYPNPEDPKAFALAKALAEKIGADLIIGTDPDADRVGVIVKNASGERTILTGNMTGVILEEYILSQKKAMGTLPGNAAIISTIVSTDLAKVIAESYGASYFNVLTGFKYIGEQVNRLEKASAGSFFFGYEESYGFLTGLHARDKDAVSACMLLCEMAAEYKAGGFTLLDRLEQLFKRFGYYVDAQETHAFPGADGAAQMEEILHALRADSQPLCDPGEKRRDYNEGLDGLPCENVLKYTFNNNWVAIRPSGTEPKLKLYYSICRDSQSEARECLAKLQQTVKERINVK